MLRSIRVLSLCLLSLIVFSCGKNDSPSSITEKFLSAITKENYEDAKIYGTDDTDRLLNMMSGFKNMGAEPFMKDAKFDVVDETINGDEAKVKVKVDGRAKDMTLSLEKEDGKWKVAMSKDIINKSDANIIDLGATSTDTSGSK